MTHKIKRTTVFELHKNIAEEISGIQRALHDESYVFENKDEQREYDELFDAKNLSKIEIKRYYKVISFHHSDLNTFTEKLYEKVSSILLDLEITNLIIISHYKINLFGNLNIKYKPLQNAYKQLHSFTDSYEYKDAFKIDLKDLAVFLNIAFWIERIDASGPEYIFFCDEQNRLAFFICKDGNIHTTEFENEMLTQKILAKNDWHEILENCHDKFSNDGKIRARKIKL